LGLACQPWILAGERSGLLTRIAAMEGVSLCEGMKSSQRIFLVNQTMAQSIKHP
jgi:hypothetical protein